MADITSGPMVQKRRKQTLNERFGNYIDHLSFVIDCGHQLENFQFRFCENVFIASTYDCTSKLRNTKHALISYLKAVKWTVRSLSD